jgi:hypothetical protein
LIEVHECFAIERHQFLSETIDGSPRLYFKIFDLQIPSRAKIGVFGDIHFKDKGLERIKKTGEWIIDEFKA